jgi:hypothetical protein
MEQSTIISICISAFIAIFIVLSLLALIMHYIVILFPQKQSEAVLEQNQVDSAVIAAITTTYQAVYPGGKITEIREKK